MNRRSFDIDFITLLMLFGLALMGWLTIYAVSSGGGEVSLFDMDYIHGKQLMWIGISLLATIVILAFDNRFLEVISYPAYIGSLLLLVLVLFIGKEVNGAKSWLIIGGLQLQPAELAKVATAMALGRYMSQLNFSLNNQRQALTVFAMIALPAVIVIAQNDTGSALVFGSFLLVFFREGLNPILPIGLFLFGVVGVMTLWIGDPLTVTWILLGIALLGLFALARRKKIGGLAITIIVATVILIGASWSTDTLVKNLAPHQQTRIMVLFQPDIDPLGAGYNVNQSKIAIGSGGFWGKGYLQGYYTKGDFVPKQETDFIFCTLGEEVGWVGTTAILFLFFLLLLRIRYLAENSKTRYARIYGYSVLSILFFHLIINVGMTVGLAPVIGIPLPFFSYGGSSLVAFTVMVAILVNLYSYRSTVLGTKN